VKSASIGLGLFGVLAFAGLCAVTACGDDSSGGAPTDDAGTTDAMSNDAPSSSDAGADTNIGDGQVGATVTLAASSTSVTAEGDVTLTASVAGGTPTSVAFIEGTTTLGTKTGSPFAQVVSFTFAENGAHTYVAKATMPGGAVLTSAPVTINVNVAPNGVFVNPDTGSDTNAGTAAAPVKTIQKALTLVTTGQNVYLMDGTYDTASQTSLSWSAANPVFIRALSANGVTLTGNGAASNGFSLAQGGGVRRVTFQNFNAAITVAGGTFKANDVKFSGVGLPCFIGGSTVAVIDESGVTGFLTNVPNAPFAAFLAVDAAADVTLKGGGNTISGVTNPGTALFVRGTAKLRASDLTFVNWPGHVVVLNDNAQVKLTNIVTNGSGLGTSSGYDKAAILMGGQNTATPLTEVLELENTTLSTCPGPAITLSVYAATASTPIIKLTNSHIDQNLFHGIVVNTPGGLSDALAITLKATNTTFKGNTGFGIVTPRLNGDFIGGEISNNSESGIQIQENTIASSLKIRGTKIDANGQYGILFNGNNTSTLDLGKVGDDGGIVFTNVAATKSAVRLDAQIVGSAIGNTWIPNQQGADANGKYVTATTLTSTGTNAAVIGGASLVVAP
jgi:hypothetical protein